MKLSITDFFSKCDQIRNLLEVLKTKKVSDFYFLLLGSDKVFLLKTIHPENPIHKIFDSNFGLNEDGANLMQTLRLT